RAAVSRGARAGGPEQRGRTVDRHRRQQGHSDGAARRGETSRRSSHERREGEQETDGVYRLRLFGGSAHTHAGAIGGDVVSRCGSASGATASSAEQTLLGGTQS